MICDLCFAGKACEAQIACLTPMLKLTPLGVLGPRLPNYQWPCSNCLEAEAKAMAEEDRAAKETMTPSTVEED